MGSRMLNGLGGSADFLRSAKISIMHTPSTRPSKTDPTGVSCIVPMCTHVDQTEHDLDIIVTEQYANTTNPTLCFIDMIPGASPTSAASHRENVHELSSTNARIQTTSPSC